MVRSRRASNRRSNNSKPKKTASTSLDQTTNTAATLIGKTEFIFFEYSGLFSCFFETSQIFKIRVGQTRIFVDISFRFINFLSSSFLNGNTNLFWFLVYFHSKILFQILPQSRNHKAVLNVPKHKNLLEFK